MSVFGQSMENSAEFERDRERRGLIIPLGRAATGRTGAEQKPLVDRGWLPPHRVERLKEYVEALRAAGALVEAGIITEILDGFDPDYG